MPSETDKMKRAGATVYGSKKKGADEATVFHFATIAQGEKYLKEEGALASWEKEIKEKPESEHIGKSLGLRESQVGSKRPWSTVQNVPNNFHSTVIVRLKKHVE